MDLNFLRMPPFNLGNEAIDWVSETFLGLSDREKVGQVFNLISMGEDEGEAQRLADFQPGGITRFFGPDIDSERERIAAAQKNARVPLLVSADLEGSRMSLRFGTSVPNPLALAAIDDEKVTKRISQIMAREADAVGLNWSFSPVIDINAAFKSAIVATRGYGSDVDRIERHAVIQIRAFQKAGLAATVKHWPGEGYDDRDQHLVTTINPLSMDEWEATFGRLYRRCIDEGVLAVMSAHIALPAFMAELGIEDCLEAYRPASINRKLNIDLLRDRLGFNGLIISDSSEMAGLHSFMPAPASKVEVLANGCDMILFSNNIGRDFEAVLNAVATGELDRNRFENAVLRVLGLKAALSLHKSERAVEQHDIIARDADKTYVDAVLRRAPTLVKDKQNLLPLDPQRHRRVLVFAGDIVDPIHSHAADYVIFDRLAALGFEITHFHAGMENAISPDAYDLVLYVFAEETLLTRNRIFLDWAKISGGFLGAMNRYWHHIPTAMISFGYPYYLYDAPRVPTYINAYSTMDEMQEAVVDLLLGRSPWNSLSPVDPYAGAADARY